MLFGTAVASMKIVFVVLLPVMTPTLVLVMIVVVHALDITACTTWSPWIGCTTAPCTAVLTHAIVMRNP